MRILLVSTYELGHQPLHVASPAAALRGAGHDVRCLDTSIQAFDESLVDWADAVGISVPMHTAMRLGLQVARRVKERAPELPVVLYGLYAPVSRDTTVGRLADRVIAGEYEPALVAWANGVAGRGDSPSRVIHLDRGSFSLPARDLLPPLERYARFAVDGEERLAGYVEATHGCLLECRHCPVPTVYGGRFRAASRDLVLEDIGQLVDGGARHITFGDPDFLNGPTHSLRIVTEMHERWPQLTFDCTTKVDHIVDHPEVWPALADSGCVFVVSALETTNDRILERLDKGHTTAQASRAIMLLREHGIEMRPSLLPFTPWTTVEDLHDLLAFVARHDLVPNVEPVMYSIRLLLPEGSLLLDHPDLQEHLGPYDPERLSYTWTPADPRTDDLQRRIAGMVENRGEDATYAGTFADVCALVEEVTGRSPLDGLPDPGTAERPHLTEAWFCCAEPTETMSGATTATG